MLKRFLLSALLVALAASPSFAQRSRERVLTKDSTEFLTLFRPVIEKAAKGTVRVQVDDKDVALGTVVSKDGYLVTKASEIKKGKLSIKTRDGRAFDALVTNTSEGFDLAILKVDATGLEPVTWTPSGQVPVGNWVATVGISQDPPAVGVLSAPARTPPMRAYLGVLMDMRADRATIQEVTPGSAADKAGIKPKDVVVSINKRAIATRESLPQTLRGFRIGDTVQVGVERNGKTVELLATLGAMAEEGPPPLPGPRGDQGDVQNKMGSTLSERRTGIPTYFQTDAIIKPVDCGGPIVDLDGRVLGVTIARAGRTESHVVPSETLKALLPVLLAAKPNQKPAERTEAVRAAVKAVESAKAATPVVAEAKRVLQHFVAEEKWWTDRPIEKGPEPRAAK